MLTRRALEILVVAWHWLTHDAAWFFTLGLVVGVIQLILFWRQLKYIRESLNAAKLSADAAKLSADAAIGVALPKLLVSEIGFQDAEAPGTTDSEVVVTVTNYGRTPAFVFRETAEMCNTRTLPPVPDYWNAVDLMPSHVIERRRTYNITARYKDCRTIIDYQLLLECKEKMWVYGCVMYRDFLDKPHTLRFCASLYFPIGLVEKMRPRFRCRSRSGWNLKVA